MKLRLGTKPVYNARNCERHVKIISLVKRIFSWNDFEDKTWAELESTTWKEIEYEENEV